MNYPLFFYQNRSCVLCVGKYEEKRKKQQIGIILDHLSSLSVCACVVWYIPVSERTRIIVNLGGVRKCNNFSKIYFWDKIDNILIQL